MASKLDRLQKKGFKVNEAALSKIARGDQEPGGEYSEININDIEENPDNALYRELDTEEDIALLADDIRRAGLLHNLVVFPKTGVGGKYVLLSGERRLRALRLLVEQDKREQEEKQLPNRMSEWQKVQCKVVRNLTENEKVVYIDSANLQVRGGISNERVMRQAAARFVENLQKAPYNLSAAEAKKALKEVSPLNSRTIDKALSIQNDLNPDLRRLLDEEFLNRAECETYLRLTLEEQARAAAVFLKIAALDPRSHERRAIKDALTTAMLDVAVERRSMQERESVFAAALQNAQDAIGQAKTQENKAAAVDKDHNFISAKLPTTARKLRKIAAAKNIEAKIRSYTAEDRKAMSDQMQELIAAAQELKALIDAVSDIEGVAVFNLYDQQGASFDVDEWSKIISDASALIYQFPFHWMAAPSLLKKWQDEVFTFLSKTPAVAGKPLTVVTTTGSEYEAYRSGGRNRFTVDELLRPYQVSAIHSGMSWQTPVVVYGMGTADAGKNIAEGANLYKQRVEMLIGSSNAGNNW